MPGGIMQFGQHDIPESFEHLFPPLIAQRWRALGDGMVISVITGECVLGAVYEAYVRPYDNYYLAEHPDWDWEEPQRFMLPDEVGEYLDGAHASLRRRTPDLAEVTDA